MKMVGSIHSGEGNAHLIFTTSREERAREPRCVVGRDRKPEGTGLDPPPALLEEGRREGCGNQEVRRLGGGHLNDRAVKLCCCSCCCRGNGFPRSVLAEMPSWSSRTPGDSNRKRKELKTPRALAHRKKTLAHFDTLILLRLSSLKRTPEKSPGSLPLILQSSSL